MSLVLEQIKEDITGFQKRAHAFREFAEILEAGKQDGAARQFRHAAQNLSHAATELQLIIDCELYK